MDIEKNKAGTEGVKSYIINTKMLNKMENRVGGNIRNFKH